MSSINKLLNIAKKYNTKRNQSKVIKGIEGLRTQSEAELKAIQTQIDSELSGIAKLERERNKLLSEKQKRMQKEKLSKEVSSLSKGEIKAMYKDLGISQK